MKVDSIYLDTDPKDQPKGTARHIRNMINSKWYSGLVNEPGFALLPGFNPSKKDVIGFIPLLEEKVLYFMADSVNFQHEIALYDLNLNLNASIYINSGLNFGLSHPIGGEFHKNFKNDYIVFFTDNFNPPRIINLGDITNATSISATLFFPSLSQGAYPSLQTTILDNGGAVLAGAYYFAIQLENQSGVLSNWTYLSNPVYIVDEPLSGLLDNIDGADGATVTSKAIKIDIDFNNAVGIYTKYNLALVSQNNGVVATQLIHSGAVKSNESYIYTGIGSYQTLTLEDIIVKTPFYKTVKAHTQLNNILYLGNLTSQPDINFQAIANQVLINYTTKNIDIEYPEDLPPTYKSTKVSQLRTFLPFEIYAFYVHFVLANGSITSGYHIPGRPAVTGDKTVLSAINTDTGLPNSVYQNFQIYDTCNASGATTNMGYWENSNEVYPDTLDATGNRLYPTGNVRHHRFPSSFFLKSTRAGDAYGTVLLALLGITASNIVIPPSLDGDITGWFISYAKRNQSTQAFVGQSLLQSTGVSGSITNQQAIPIPAYYVPTAGSWSNFYQITADGGGENSDGSKLQSYDFVKFNSPEIVTFKPNVNPTFIRNEYVLTIRSPEGWANIPVTGGEKQIYRATFDYIRDAPAFGTPNVLLTPSPSNPHSTTRIRGGVLNGSYDDRIKAVTANQYIPSNSSAPLGGATFNNEGGEDALLMRLGGNALGFSANPADPRYGNGFHDYSYYTRDLDANISPGFDPGQYVNPIEEAYLSTLIQFSSDVYDSFYDQQLIRATDESDVSSVASTPFYFGDGYICDYSYYSSAFGTTEAYASSSGSGIHNTVQVIHRFMCYSNININYRYENPLQGDYGKYYPKSPDIFVNSILNNGVDSSYQDANLWSFNKDFDALPSVDGLPTFNPFDETTDKFPDRIIFGETAIEESPTLKGWTIFLANNLYEMPRNRGEIVNLQAFEDLIFIHHRYSLYKTRNITNLKTTSEDVTLGSPGIFTIAPIEVVSSDSGYFGNQNQFASILTKYGYVFLDVEKSEIVIAGREGEKKISDVGIKNFLKDNLNQNISPTSSPLNLDNPFSSNGLTIVYDDRYDRLIFTNQINPSLPITMSYSFLNNKWVSFHDYQPTYMFGSRNGLFSLNGGSLYRHNIPTVRGIYYGNTTPTPCFIVVVENDNVKTAKLYQEILFDLTLKSTIDDTRYKDLSFNKITVADSYQCSGEIPLTVFGGFSSIYNTRKVKNKWRFNGYRDLNDGSIVSRFFDKLYNLDFSTINNNKLFHQKLKFMDAYLLIKLQYDNKDIDAQGNQLEVIVHDIDVAAYPILR